MGKTFSQGGGEGVLRKMTLRGWALRFAVECCRGSLVLTTPMANRVLLRGVRARCLPRRVVPLWLAGKRAVVFSVIDVACIQL